MWKFGGGLRAARANPFPALEVADLRLAEDSASVDANVRAVMLNALRNVHPSHLLDRELAAYRPQGLAQQLVQLKLARDE